MDTNFTPLSDKIDFPHTYVLASSKQEQQDQSSLSSPPSSLTRLDHVRLATEEAAIPYFKKIKNLIDWPVSDLKGEKLVPWNKVSNIKLLFMSKKAIQIALNKLLKELAWERLCEHFQECRQRLKENFHQFYWKIREKQEALKGAELKNQIRQESS